MDIFNYHLLSQSPSREAVTQHYYADETACVEALIEKLPLSSDENREIENIATDLVNTVRDEKNDQSSVEALMMEYDLSSDEGTVLMCLAEALLRIPDKETEALLIRDKLTSADWEKHIGESESTFVNLTTRSLSLGGKVLGEHASFFKKAWYGLLGRCGEPVIRQAIRRSMKIMSEHFVLGRTIDEALKNAKPLAETGYLFSFDMLGEMARTQAQADYYFAAYQNAIKVMSESTARDNAFLSPSISIKLSALHPRYEFVKQETVAPFLIDRLKTLALQAKDAGIYVTVDAEEAYRLEISLDIFAAVFADPAFSNWNGLGLAVQAYQKRAYVVLEYLIELARTHKKKICVRLVKGAYWDTEIKIAQVGGYENYPVFTRKVSTDVGYLACAHLLLSAQDAIYPQFATHNAYSVAAILFMTRGKNATFEFQNLQGMGKPLHNVLVTSEKYHANSRIYAPVGQHQDLLPYLVRRLLENGANSSFVHQIANRAVPVRLLTRNPIEKLQSYVSIPNEKIPLPENIYPQGRKNSRGFDLTRVDQLAQLSAEMQTFAAHQWHVTPTNIKLNKALAQPVVNPNNHEDIVGFVQLAEISDVDVALSTAQQVQYDWDQMGVEKRAELLEKTADLMELHQAELFALLIREAGKFMPDAISEVREAVDFCRYYAMIARKILSPKSLVGPTGESNVLRMQGLGVMICVSPWNFPLAIFTGQMAASLVAGNCVIAKPAGQTPLIAARAVALFHEAGVPKSVLQLMPGSGGKMGNALIADERSSGVLFTGSTDTAKIIQRTLAAREGAIVPLIAETGGMNPMIIDSSALLEQAVGDVMVSAFGSAGQRCSALRIVFVQEDVADHFIEMLAGAMQTWSVGNSDDLSTDVGPVIDAASQKTLQTHIEHMHREAKCIAQMPLSASLKQGTFIAPVAFEIPQLSILKKEVFGPVLHVLRFKRKDLTTIIDDINQLGYGLTLGIQSRIACTIDEIQKRIKTGNIYVNRNMTGAVVGVQPFGGCGLSGTGPKAGGPHYLLRLCRENTLTTNTTAMGGNAQLLTLDEPV
ncbi:MAG: bifunctional proline dehydrogenase/L-glutamate gamma-semialdehyde dehydrogenase [Gammaproteobacteria bacterium CG_4_10_14_0_8_um_filter_38_16]|nr:MAG: bifunctional proline dehydrogenase/L-glutamate gamma-semialdehyde dehydrogenase [Gammaproteobacteria bacterium CG_4_10_14_0_8_um_filter_38_16]PJA03088.1 MAG: bifunctional proline dehydrogenase/L-glutamate gamma-semialdehyde dehydrogenase [Gammaproteobacteria bacterium CG_4_10_14_0_2_um_filter_38_22]PJB10292.1 MAG: bifunctional proline dehydrogenase/L-glutamate gamma-semialdehyde dehydrogenase [Gammaproteobacteria bacterium CG_4_9_14_3_um_filter_38_9]